MKNSNPSFSIANVLAALGLAGAMVTGYVSLAAENAQQRERVDNLKEQAKEIKRDVKETNENVQLILRKLDAMEAAQKAAERRRPQQWPQTP